MESSSEMEAVTGYQLYLDSEPVKMRLGSCGLRGREKQRKGKETVVFTLCDLINYIVQNVIQVIFINTMYNH